jgi:hypothetical protein
MGMFELSCAVSGLGTQWCSSLEEGLRSTASMMLIECVDGVWLPLCPPVSGVYDAYGRIEVGEAQMTRALEHVDQRIDAMLGEQLLTIGDARDLGRQRSSGLGSAASAYIAHAQQMLWFYEPVRIGENPIGTVLIIDEVLKALSSHLALEQRHPVEQVFQADRADPGRRAACCDWLYEQGRSALADYLRVEGGRGTFGSFGPAHETVNLRPFHAVAAWMVEHKGGFKPLTLDDGPQRTRAEEAEALREIWLEGHPAISQLIEKHDPALAAEWRKTAAPARTRSAGFRAGRST